jgi:hypothetical protein
MLVLLLILVGIATAQILSIDQVQGYKGLRECALNCYNGYGFDKPGYNIASELSCQPYNSPGDACFCRTDLQNVAVDGLSSCVAGSCRAGADLDISSATQIYKDYCTSAGYTQKAANVPAKTTGGERIWDPKSVSVILILTSNSGYHDFAITATGRSANCY